MHDFAGVNSSIKGENESEPRPVSLLSLRVNERIVEYEFRLRRKKVFAERKQDYASSIRRERKYYVLESRGDRR